MSQQPTRPDPSDPASAPASALSRRRVFAGAGTVGALAAVAAVLPSVAPETGPVQAAAQPKRDADTSAGYQLTDHVRRYYQTTRV